MWISTLDLSPKRVIATQLLRPFWPGVCFSSLAPLRVQNVPRQSLPASSWVRVRNRLAGICGSDLHLIYADGDLRIAPAAIPGHQQFYLGHEVVGEVIEIGDDVQQLHVGDRVTLQHNPNCLSAGIQPPCRSCAAGNYNLCEQGTFPGPEPIGGGWSEEMLLHEQQLFRLPAQLNDEQAVLIEPAAVALHAVLRRPPQAGERILIIGAGTIGLLTLQIVRALAPQVQISVLARHGFQVEQATRQGAAHIIYPQDSYIGIQRATDALLYQGPAGNQMLLGGYDVIYDTVGQRKTLHHALRWARSRATVVLVGTSLHMMRIDLTPIWYQEVNLIGSLGHGMETWPIGTNERRATFSIVAEMIERGAIRPEQLITHHFALDNYRHALTTAASKANSRAIKVVFDYSLQPASVVPTVRASARLPRPATVGTRPATRPLAKSSSHPTEHAALPVTPLPSVPLTPLIDEPEPPEHVEQPERPAPASSAPTPAPTPRSIAHNEPANDDDHGDLEDTLVALPAIRKPFKPVKLVPTAPAPSNHTAWEQKTTAGPIPESPAHPAESADMPDTPPAESGAGTSALPFELPVMDAQSAAPPFTPEPEFPGKPLEADISASEIIEADAPALSEATQEAGPSDSFETRVEASSSEIPDTSQLFYEFANEPEPAAPATDAPYTDAEADAPSSEVAEQPAVAPAEASFQFYEWENEPGTAIDAAIAGTLEPSYEFVSQLFATPETTNILSENAEEIPLLEFAEQAASLDSGGAIELPDNASPIEAAQSQTSEADNMDEVGERPDATVETASDAATAVESPVESREAETVEAVEIAETSETPEIPATGEPENAAEEIEAVETAGAAEPQEVDASSEQSTSPDEEISTRATEEASAAQENNEPPLQNGTEGASTTKKRPRSRKKNRT